MSLLIRHGLLHHPMKLIQIFPVIQSNFRSYLTRCKWLRSPRTWMLARRTFFSNELSWRPPPSDIAWIIARLEEVLKTVVTHVYGQWLAKWSMLIWRNRIIQFSNAKASHIGEALCGSVVPRHLHLKSASRAACHRTQYTYWLFLYLMELCYC